MKIAVCIKQVPAVSEGLMDPKTGVMIRSALQSVINTYDLPALETALQIKDKIEVQIDVFTMGPPSALEIVKEAFSMGADNGYLICDTAFGGADVLATSYTLKQAICSIGQYDLILCGRQTTDGDTAQVSGALAKQLNIAHINWVSKILDCQKEFLIAEHITQNYIVTSKIQYPCLLSIEHSACVPRMPSLKLRMEAKKKEVHLLTLEDMEDKNENHYGLKGSATRVEKIFTPEKTQKHSIAYYKNSKEAAEVLYTIINKINSK